VEVILVSACLLGVNCKYNAGNNLNKEAIKLLESELVIPVCPEQLGGCPTPRIPAEITGGSGADVLDGKNRVMTKNGEDRTEEFLKGANEVLMLARLMRVKKAVLKARSPSCGSGTIYDGTFSGALKAGNGITAELLKRNGIEVVSEEELRP